MEEDAASQLPIRYTAENYHHRPVVATSERGSVTPYFVWKKAIIGNVPVFPKYTVIKDEYMVDLSLPSLLLEAGSRGSTVDSSHFPCVREGPSDCCVPSVSIACQSRVPWITVYCIEVADQQDQRLSSIKASAGRLSSLIACQPQFSDEYSRHTSRKTRGAALRREIGPWPSQCVLIRTMVVLMFLLLGRRKTFVAIRTLLESHDFDPGTFGVVDSQKCSTEMSENFDFSQNIGTPSLSP